MSDLRHQILDAIKVALADISKVNGYNYDIYKITREQRHIKDIIKSEKMGIFVGDPLVKFKPAGHKIKHCLMTIVITGVMKKDTVDDELELLGRDIEDAMLKTDKFGIPQVGYIEPDESGGASNRGKGMIDCQFEIFYSEVRE